MPETGSQTCLSHHPLKPEALVSGSRVNVPQERKKETQPSSSSFDHFSRVNGYDSSSRVESPLEALRALVAELHAVGVRDPIRLLRVGTVRWAQRALLAFGNDPGKGVAWLETVLCDGASRLPTGYENLSALDRRRIDSFDSLLQERTDWEWPT